MSVTFGVSGTLPFADYSPTQVADLLYKYFGTNWSITTPATINKAAVFLTTDPAQMKNRPDPGSRSLWLWVQHNLLDSGKDILGSGLGYTGNIPVRHTFNIHFMMSRLPQGMTFPELDLMAGEIMRLTFQYHLAPIQGITSLSHFTLMQGEEATTLGQAYSGMYKMSAIIMAVYEKLSTA
jgi:hypothetical protein